MYQYADDTQIYMSFHNEDQQRAELIINQDINKLLHFSEDHGLSINPSKSNLMLFGRPINDDNQHIELKINNQLVRSTKVARNLGLMFDNALRFKSHVSGCIKGAYASLKTLHPHRHYLSRALKIMLCHTLVLSHFNFSDVVYGPCLSRDDSMRIERAQKSCLTFIYGIRRYDRISHKLKDARWLNMQQRREIHAINLFHKVIYFRSPPYLFKKINFRTEVHNLNLRFRGYISPPYHNTTFFERSFSYNIYKLYNSIPDFLKSYHPKQFKHKLKIHFKQLYL
nr:unnamed protein product [Callosobruchus chinensis]